MIVGTLVIPVESLRANVEDLEKYARKLIPKFVSPSKALVSNNMYYIGLLARKMEKLDYRTRMRVVDHCFASVSQVRGILNVLTDVDDLFRVVDMNKVLGHVFGGIETERTEEELHAEIERLLCRTQSKRISTS